MDASEIMILQASRENWRAISIILMSAIAILPISSVTYTFGKVAVEEKVRRSGYTLAEIYAATNSYYAIEKVR